MDARRHILTNDLRDYTATRYWTTAHRRGRWLRLWPVRCGPNGNRARLHAARANPIGVEAGAFFGEDAQMSSPGMKSYTLIIRRTGG
ncbi:MAG: hypothetical protein HC828_06930 [Blastochloris sp.]|nr:hypothetical protein [Blastochloris sp.]